jgi:hypothetical protein
MAFADDYTVPLAAMFIEATDPAVTYPDGRVKAGRLWLDTSTGTRGTLKKRNAANNDWDTMVDLDQVVTPVSSHFSGLVDGGQVVWESAYTFRVSAAQYYVQGILHSSVEQTITLDAADATLDRIDVLALNTSGTLVKVTGTAAAQPSEPDIDPTTQLKITFVFVAAASTEPNVTNEDIYLENTEWTSSTSGSGWNANSTINPRTGTKTIEGTNVGNGAYVQLQRASTITLDDFASLVLFIRSKATWNNNRVLRLQFFNAGVARGSAVTVASGYWGFDSSNVSGYQLVAIPVSQFVLPAGTLINQLRITDSGGAIGLYVDDISLQATGGDVGGGSVFGITQEQADARYVRLTEFAEAVEDKIGETLTDNTDIDWTYDDGAATVIATLKGGAGALNPAFVTLTDAVTVTWATNGARVNNAKVTLGGNRTLDITGEVDGASGVLIVVQDGTGSRTLTLPGSSKVIGGGAGAITLSTAAGSIDILSWVYDGTDFYWTKGLNYT